MAKPEHGAIVQQGAEAIEQWWMGHPGERLDLVEAALSQVDFSRIARSPMGFSYDLLLEDKGFSLMWRLFSVDNPSRASGSACLLETRITPKSATHEQQ